MEEDAEDEEDEVDHSCQKCGQSDHPEWILLCDHCDLGWHASCLKPPLMVIPEGNWYCPPCEHVSAKKRKKKEKKIHHFNGFWNKRKTQTLRVLTLRVFTCHH